MNPKIQSQNFGNPAKIKVIGVGGAGGSAVNRMVHSKIRGVEFIVLNTDAQALRAIDNSIKKIRIGRTLTKGLGSGMNPEIGRKAIEESQNEVKEALKGADLVFLTAGLGGGTGTGAAPLVADLAREVGALTIAIITKPFAFEGSQRMIIAERGLKEIIPRVDAIITIPNDRVLYVIDRKTPLLEAFLIVDEILKQGVQGISEIITIPGLVNVDFADIRTILQGAGSALLGIGRAEGEGRAVQAAKAALENPLLDLSTKGAQGILFTLSGGPDLTMTEVNEIAKIITESADPGAKIIFGAIIDESLANQIKLTLIATGFNTKESKEKTFLTPEQKIIPSKRVEVKLEQKSIESNIEDKIKKSSEDELEIPAFIRKKLIN